MAVHFIVSYFLIYCEITQTVDIFMENIFNKSYSETHFIMF
jgi:hypothetical protein